MLARIQFAIQVRRLQRRRREISDKYAALMRQTDKNDEEAVRTVEYEESMARDDNDGEIADLQSSYLVLEAERLLLPLPEFNQEGGAWEQSRPGRYRLNDYGRTMMLGAIRKERKERREQWHPWLTSLTGLVGALIGLLALILKK